MEYELGILRFLNSVHLIPISFYSIIFEECSYSNIRVKVLKIILKSEIIVWISSPIRSLVEEYPMYS